MHNNQKYHFQAHRGGLDEVYENTLTAMQYAWTFPSAIPETDVRQIADGTLVCCHDETLKRTGRGDTKLLVKPLATMSLAELQSIDIGGGERVPLLSDLLALMQKDTDHLLYLEIKEAPLDEVVSMLKKYRVLSRIRFVHKDQTFCQRVQALLPQAPTMTWCSGSPDSIVKHFYALAESGFSGITEVQIHFPATMERGELSSPLPPGFLQHAVKSTQEKGRVLQVCPIELTPELLGYLYKERVRSFVSNAPRAFTEMMKEALGS
ncbi:MAG: glycerophosphodiester phosphodiesterase family protein [Sphaerochaeta sp.]|nr:glycerophosphodiester phosphodiesterase family protein [Sphaerochaeta sp.]